MLSIEVLSDAIMGACIGHEAAERLKHSANGRDASVLEFMAAASVPHMMAIGGSTQRSRVVREPPFEPGRLVMTSGV